MQLANDTFSLDAMCREMAGGECMFLKDPHKGGSPESWCPGSSLSASAAGAAKASRHTCILTLAKVLLVTGAQANALTICGGPGIADH